MPGTAGNLHLPAPTTISRSLFDDMPKAARNPKQLRGTKVGVYFDWVETAQPGVLTAFRRALKHAAELGCEASTLLSELLGLGSRGPSQHILTVD